ncbi:MAG: DUF4919 domain-containing protein [Planctomycetes bacterium]|nr:DUF4919 domain-containing protein [Planctomycetota bacterium]
MNPFITFIEKPSKETFLAVRETVLTSPDYQPYSTDLTGLHGLIGESDWKAIIDSSKEMLPNFLLSPGYHMALAKAYKELGNEEGLQAELTLAKVCVDGIKLTGEGTREQPWLVLRTSDEYDLLGEMGKKSKQQSLVEVDGRKLDHQLCEDESEYYFDVTDPMSHMSRQFGN